MATLQDVIAKLYTDFAAICHHDEEIGTEFWLARELQPLLGYTQYRNFEAVIEKAMVACETSGQAVEDHFANVSKLVDIGSGAQRDVEDIHFILAALLWIIWMGWIVHLWSTLDAARFKPKYG